MQDADLFMELAGIAGVFVGFGALIAVRSGGASGAFEMAYMRGVVSMGLLTVVAALAPVTLGRYDLAEHQVLSLSSVLFVAGLLGTVAANARTPEWSKAEEGQQVSRWVELSALAVMLSLIGAVLIIPIVIIWGQAPDLEAALYFTAVVLVLIWDAWLLLQLVFRGHVRGAAEQRRAGERGDGDDPSRAGAAEPPFGLPVPALRFPHPR